MSMSCKGRCFDNIYVEKLWRTIKYEDGSGDLENGLKNL